MAMTLEGPHGDTPRVCSFAVGMATMALCTDWFLTSLAIPIFPELGADAVATGVLFGSKAIAQIVVAPVVGHLVDCWGLSVLLIGLLVEGATVGVFAMTFGYLEWLIARSVQGVASAFIAASALGHLAIRFRCHDELLGRAMSIAIAGLITGISFGPPIGGFLFAIDRRFPYVLAFMLLLITLALTLAETRSGRGIVSADKKSAASSGTPPASTTSWLLLLGDPLIYVPLLAVLCTNTVIASYEAGIGIFAHRAFGFQSRSTGILFAWESIPCAIASFAVGNSCVQRFGRWNIVAAGVAIMAIGCAVGPKNVLAILAPSLALIGIGIGASAGTIPALLGAAAKQYGGTAAVYSMQNCAEQIGFFIGPVFGNWVSEILGFGASSMMSAVALILLVPLVRQAKVKADLTMVQHAEPLIVDS